MSVKVTLNPLPKSALLGDTVTFSGRAMRSGRPYEGGYITPWLTDFRKYLKNSDGSFVVGHTDKSGAFSIPWTAWDQEGLIIGRHNYQVIENNHVIFSNAVQMSVSDRPAQPDMPALLSVILVGLSLAVLLGLVAYAAWGAQR